MHACLLRALIWAVLCIGRSLEAPRPYPNLTKLVDDLWELDANRLEMGTDVVLDLQGEIRARRMRKDLANKPLFTFVNEKRLNASKSFKAYMDLIPFYNPDVRVNETNTTAKTACQERFVASVMATAVMQEAQRYLVKLKLAPPTMKAFTAMLRQIWFSDFMRKKQMNSSPFEHVFLGEARGSRVQGFHYWLRLYLEEKLGQLNYLGYYPRPKKASNVTNSISFQWGTEGQHQWFKEFDTFLFGSSPEFDMALYTAAFLTMHSIWPDTFRLALSLKTENLGRLVIQCYLTAHQDSKIRRLGSCYVV